MAETSDVTLESPKGQAIDRDLLKPFGVKKLMLNQKRAGCCCSNETCCCPPNNEFDIVDGKKKALYSIEESSCCCRYFCMNCRASHGKITTSGDHKTSLVEYDRPLRCMPVPCFPCCNQLMTFTDGKGTYLGEATVPCYFFIPTIVVKDENKKPIYNVHQPTCCGCCVNWCAAGCCSCKTPYHVYPTNFKKAEDHDKHIGKINKLSDKFDVEFVESGDQFEVDFPPAAGDDDKARLTLTALFINMLFYEAGRGTCCGC